MRPLHEQSDNKVANGKKKKVSFTNAVGKIGYPPAKYIV